MSAAYEVVCPFCGGELDEQASGVRSHVLRTDVLACRKCGSEVQLVLRLQPVRATRDGLQIQRERDSRLIFLRDRQAPFAGLIELMLEAEAELRAESQQRTAS